MMPIDIGHVAIIVVMITIPYLVLLVLLGP